MSFAREMEHVATWQYMPQIVVDSRDGEIQSKYLYIGYPDAPTPLQRAIRAAEEMNEHEGWQRFNVVAVSP